MMEHIIKTGRCEGDLVADFFMGSGTTLKVVLGHNRWEWKWQQNGLSRLRV
ncbi:DNA methyltransferase [Morganella morganii]|uniref:DNA methyltransferase n=1 Tax=Morganella morganii TaxID=582 RepID=UPI003D678089